MARASWLWILPFLAGIGTGVVFTISMKFLGAPGSSYHASLEELLHGPPQHNLRKPDDDETKESTIKKVPGSVKGIQSETKEQPAQQQQRDVEKTEKPDESSSPKKKKPLNIVLLYADDMRYDSIGIAGTSIVKTPYIDALSKQGMRFTHNCVTTSVCWISRATLYSGKYFSRHNTSMPNDAVFYNDWQHSWPHLLNKAGYHLGHVGKWHFDSRPVEKDFHFWRSYYGSHFMGKTHVTKKNELDGLDFLRQRPQDKPFVLSVCFFAPHSEDGNPDQYIPQNSSMSLYNDINVPLPKSANRWNQDKPYFFGETNEARYRWRLRFKNPELHQRMMKNYYRLISEVDYASGKIVEELEKQGILDETLVIFTTDNGYFHSEHGFAGKWYPHQESIRVPLVIRDPRMPKEKVGKTSDAFTLNIDLAETILGAAGVEVPNVMQGRDISDLYLDDPKDKTPWRDEFFYEHPVHLHTNTIPASTALVNKQWKYMNWPDYNFEQLFNLEEDPYEMNDLFNVSEHKQVLNEMRVRYAELATLAK